jgi:hypothetical protein
MIRRRRRQREIAFSFDSFLDVVANVVGIIIRLILVVWVGARSYTGIPVTTTNETAVVEAEPALPKDPLQDELEQRRRELAQAQNHLLAQLRQLQAPGEKHDASADDAKWTSRRQELEQERAELESKEAQRDRFLQMTALSGEELRERSRRLAQEIKAIEKLPSPKKTYRYKTPVSQPVQADELLFECQAGRVAFIDIGLMLQDVRIRIKERGEALRDHWQVDGTVGPVGAYRLRYLIERDRGPVDVGGTPDAQASFRYGLTAWVVDPIAALRGEPIDVALAANSDFRRIVDGIDPQHTVVTFFVYPDSFAAFRQARDFLYERDVVVAGRPLPQGAPIASSRNGTRSRGQ